MTVAVGSAGADVRGDVRVTVTEGSGAIHVTSPVKALYGDAIEEAALAMLRSFSLKTVDLTLEDSGALPFVLEARLEAALMEWTGEGLLPIEGSAGRQRERSARRSRLYVPGGVPKMFPNAGLYRPDVVILDLEDSVADSEKTAARVLVRRALRALEFDGCERAVRINAGERGKEDLMAVAEAGVDLVLVPKCESGDELRELAAILEDTGSKAELLPILESALGIHRAFDLAISTPKVTGLAFGTEDYLTDIGARRRADGAESQFALGAVVNAARAARVTPLASVFSKVDDEDGLMMYCQTMRDLGFEGVGCIHPRQVRAVHAAFRPSEGELVAARRLVLGYEAAVSEGRGVVAVDGQMVDTPVYERAKAVLRRAEEGP